MATNTAAPEPEIKPKSTSKTVTDTVTGEHEHTIIGYSLVKGIGDGEPIASERFTVGGHEWVLLFYPDGKRSSSPEGANPLHHPPPGQPVIPGQPQFGIGAGLNDQNGQNQGNAGDGQAAGNAPRAAPANNAQGGAAGAAGQNANAPQQAQHHRREATNDYAALFVALIGETDNPQGVVNTSEGRVVRAFHRFTLVDQTGGGRDLTKGRRRDQGAVKISCARQDPNARNCHGYRKFVKRSVLENPNSGYLHNDTLIIRYCIELVVSTGGALSKQTSNQIKANSIQVPPPSLGLDLARLLESGENSDVMFKVEDESLPAHRIILTSRSIMFNALLKQDMREGKEGVVTIEDVRAPVFRALLHFIYTDSMPEEIEESGLEVAMAQHLLVAADRFQLGRLRRICERRLCESVEVSRDLSPIEGRMAKVSTVATTMALADQNHAEELKRVCLDFISKNLSAVMVTEGYQHMISSCPSLQSELLSVLAEKGNGYDRMHRRHREHTASDGPQDAEVRRVRPRRE